MTYRRTDESGQEIAISPVDGRVLVGLAEPRDGLLYQAGSWLATREDAQAILDAHDQLEREDRAAEHRGYQRAIAALREHDAMEAQRFAEVTRKYPGNWDGWPYAHPFGRAAHYLESLAPKEPTDD